MDSDKNNCYDIGGDILSHKDMLFNLGIIIYAFLFGYFAWKHFRYAALAVVLLLPAYLIRFSARPLPSTVLELSFGIVFLVWLVRFARADFPRLKNFYVEHRYFVWCAAAFLISAFISVFVSGIRAESFWGNVFNALGIWRAYFLEPMLFFVVLAARGLYRDLPFSLALSTLSVSIVAIVQKVFGVWYPPSLWDDELAGRAVSFFTSPNAVGLYLAPVIMLTFAVILGRIAARQTQIYLGVIILGLIAVLCARSSGAMVGLAVGMAVFVYLLGARKTVVTLGLFAVALALVVPPVRDEVLFRDRAGQNRLMLWGYTAEYLTATPGNFIWGTGMRRFFGQVQKPYYDVKEMERLIYPHNILLNFWTETGLLGLLAFIGMYAYLFVEAVKKYRADKLLGAGLIAVLVVFAVHGLVDVPYFKNDLAFLFWILAAYILGRDYLPASFSDSVFFMKRSSFSMRTTSITSVEQTERM